MSDPIDDADTRRVDEVIIHDSIESCPYLSGQRQRLPLRLQLQPLPPAHLDELLAQGDRRVGAALYRTSCPTCRACEAIRVPVATFEPSRSQRRAWLKNHPEIQVTLERPSCTRRHLALFQAHKAERGLDHSGVATSREGYHSWLVRTCVETVEMQYRLDGELVGVGIVDVGRQTASSVYFYFDPEHSWRSLGVFSVLCELSLCRELNLKYLYLGLYVADCRALCYKASYLPHERLIEGAWRRFERS